MAEERTGEAAEHFKQATKFEESKDYEKAVAEYSEVIKLMPDDVDAYSFRGRAYIQLGKTNEAKADLQKCLHICRLTRTREMEGYMWWQFGFTFQSVGNKAEAYNCYRGAYSCGDQMAEMGLRDLGMWDLLADRPIYGVIKEEKPVNAKQEKRVLTEEEKNKKGMTALFNKWTICGIIQNHCKTSFLNSGQWAVIKTQPN